MKRILSALCLAFLLMWAVVLARAQAAAPSALSVLGLRSSASQGAFLAAHYLPDGSMVLLYDQGDGLRLIQTDASATSVLAQVQEGAAGDSGVALTVDSVGNIYVAGTSTSGQLHGTPGSVFPSAADSSTNSFVASFDTHLNLRFLSFLGAPRTEVTGIAATADALFVTGVTYSSSLPVTPGAFGQTPAGGVHGSGFIERLSTDGTTLQYATYLCGTDGDTSPSAIAANANDLAYIVGETSASTFPTTSNALQPQLPGSASGFLSTLSSDGSALGFSTFVAGGGLTSIAIDPAQNNLLLSGDISLSDFGLQSAAFPIPGLSYQAALRLTADGQQVLASSLLQPGTQSIIIPGTNGTSWVTEQLTTPLFLQGTVPLQPLGDSVLLQLGSDDTLNQAFRMGGLPLNHAAYAGLHTSPAAPAISPDGSSITVPNVITAYTSTSLVPSQAFDLPLASFSSSLFNSSGMGLLPACTQSGQCTGSAGLLALVTSNPNAATLTLSAADTPNLVLRNPGATEITGLAESTTSSALQTDCLQELDPGAQCSIAVTGTGPGSLTVSAANAPPITLALPAPNGPPQPLALSPSELDFGVVGPGTPQLHTVTITNLTGVPQTFSSVADGAVSKPAYTLSEAASTCGGTPAAHTLAANATCTITLSLGPSSGISTVVPVRAFWSIGDRDVLVTGATTNAALLASTQAIDFGVRYPGLTPQTSRYLYFSNASSAPLAHTALTLPPGSPFALTDSCPSTLPPATVCQITIDYLQVNAPSLDAITLTLDDGSTVTITGEELPAPGAQPAPASPLSASPAAVYFAEPVLVTQVSSEIQAVTVINGGTTPAPVATSITGDFSLANSCSSVLAPGASCALLLQFAPSAEGTRDGVLSVVSGQSAPIYVRISGTASPLLPSGEASLDLGQTPVGERVVAWYPVQGNLANLSVHSTSAAFQVALAPGAGTAPPSLPPSAFQSTATTNCIDCWLGVRFLPQVAGVAAGLLNITSTAAGNPYTVNVTGTAFSTAGLAFDTPSQDFGSVPVHSTSAPQVLVLANLLSPATAVSVQSVTTTGDFQILTNDTGGNSCVGSLNTAASCYTVVAFRPSATGRRTGTLSIVTSGGTVTASLSGNGTADPGVALQPISVQFNLSPGAAATSATITLTNDGSSVALIGALASTSPNFVAQSGCTTLAPAAQCKLTVTFVAGSTLSSGQLTFPVTQGTGPDAVTSTYTVPTSSNYTAAGAGLLLLPSQVNFGPQPTSILGATREFTLTNLSPVTVTPALRAPQQFPIASASGCTTLAPGGTCTFSVSVLPASGGPLTGTVTAQTTAATDGSVSTALGYLLGYGQASGSLQITGPALSSGLLTFGQVTSGASASQTLTLTNAGTAPLTVHRVVSSSPFLAVTTCGQPMAPSASCKVTVTYAPVNQSSSGNASLAPRPDAATLRIESDAASSPDQIQLAGTAAPVISTNPTDSSVVATYTLSQGALRFPNTALGATSDAQQITLTNTGNTVLHFGTPLGTGDFSATSNCSTLPSLATCTVAVQYTPSAASTSSLRSGVLHLPSDAEDALEFVTLLGETATAPLSLQSSSLAFPPTFVGASATLPFTLSNTSSLPLALGEITVSGDFTFDLGNCPPIGGSLAAGQSCALQIHFAPSTAGTRTGQMQIISDASSTPNSVALSGTGLAPQLSISTPTLAFGNLLLGSSATLPLTLTNSGTAPLSALSLAVSGINSADFTAAGSCGTTLVAGAACTATITFTPQQAGSRTATLTVQGSGLLNAPTALLTGNGLAPPGLLLTVNGQPSGSATVVLGTLASYPLLLTPQNGFAGPVALTCTAISAGPNARCSLLGSQMTLTAGVPQTATANITTISSITAAWLSPLGLLSSGWLLIGRRRSARRRWHAALALVFLTGLAGLCSCGGKPGSSLGMNLTPPGTYRYQVTASSTSGATISSSVTLDLTVQQ